MKIDTEKFDSYDVINMLGSFNMSVLALFEESLNPYMDNPKHVILDFNELTNIDSSAIGLMLVYGKKFNNINKKIVVTHVNNEIKGVFELMGFEVKYKIFDSIDDAVNYIKE